MRNIKKEKRKVFNYILKLYLIYRNSHDILKEQFQTIQYLSENGQLNRKFVDISNLLDL